MKKFLDLPGPIGRSLKIFNARNSDGRYAKLSTIFYDLNRSRTTVMQISNVTGRKLMAFTKDEFQGLVNIADDIRKEIVLLEKRS